MRRNLSMDKDNRQYIDVGIDLHAYRPSIWILGVIATMTVVVVLEENSIEMLATITISSLAVVSMSSAPYFIYVHNRKVRSFEATRPQNRRNGCKQRGYEDTIHKSCENPS